LEGRLIAVSSQFLRKIFSDKFGPAKELICSVAPGRVNLIGEHTDYNGGFVLPIAIEGAISIVGTPTSGEGVEVFSYNYDEFASFSLRARKYNVECSWINYIQGVADVLIKEGDVLQGFKAVVGGDVPIGAGLSSSAAFEVASVLFFKEMTGLDMEGADVALLGQKAENEFVGVKCGIMDQYVSFFGEKEHALLLDCQGLKHKLVPLDTSSAKVIIANTGVDHNLASSQYNTRRRECREGLEILRQKKEGISSLRDVSSEEFERFEKDLPEPISRRLRHVISENERTLRAADALERSDVRTFGALMEESHRSLRDDYEVSCRELDIMVEEALGLEGVIGARMTGGGFGGCTVNLVQSSAAKTFSRRLAELYKKATGIEPVIYETPACDGARTYRF